MVVLVLMGVCGCGKTTVGQAMSEKLGWVFRDADEFHSEENKQKMSQAIPLTDEDRWPWLMAIHHFIDSQQTKGQSAVVTCSALKRCYRDVLRTGHPPTKPSGQGETSVQPHGITLTSSLTSSPTSSPLSSSSPSSSLLFVLLHGRREVLEARLAGRKGHFMPPDLLTSQLAILEELGDDENGLMVDVDVPVSHIVSVLGDRLLGDGQT